MRPNSGPAVLAPVHRRCQIPVAANHAAEIPPAVIVVGTDGLRKRAGAHELVGCGQMRAAKPAPLRAGYEFPAALGEKTVIAARHELRTVLQCDPEGRLDGAPAREHSGFQVAPIVSTAPGTVDL